MSRLSRVLVAIALILIAILFGSLVILRDIPSEAVAAFLGVLVGGIITGFVQYWISEADRMQQLRLAALDKRLQAHQEAYTLWRHLLFADKRGAEIHEVVKECQDWWEGNCLYLSSEARQAFLRSYLSAHEHANLLGIHADASLIKKAWSDVERAGEAIVRGVYLPPIGDLESKQLASQEKDGDT